MLNGILTTEDLKAITEFSRVCDVRRCLEDQGIAYFTGKNGVWTTIGLVEAAKRSDLTGQVGAYPVDTL